MQKQVNGLTCQSFLLVHFLNVPGDCTKYDQTTFGRVMFTKTETHVDILIITETFCSSKVPDSFYAIPGYNTYRKDRTGKGGGGILADVKNYLDAKHRVDLDASDLEALWLEVCPYNSKRSLFIAGIYRPPSYKVGEDKKLGKNIEIVYLLSKEMVLLGRRF